MIIDSFTGEYFFLSNFFKWDIKINDIVFPTLEHYFQYSKIDKINDPDYEVHRNDILNCDSPGAARKLGRIYLIRKDWDDVRNIYMYNGLVNKFRDQYLQGKLLNTGNSELIEGNSWGDTYWGVCNGKGKNMLGKLLMMLRDEFNDELWL